MFHVQRFLQPPTSTMFPPPRAPFIVFRPHPPPPSRLLGRSMETFFIPRRLLVPLSISCIPNSITVELTAVTRPRESRSPSANVSKLLCLKLVIVSERKHNTLEVNERAHFQQCDFKDTNSRKRTREEIMKILPIRMGTTTSQ